MTTKSDKYDSWSRKKSDMQLVEVLRGQDQQEINLAMEILTERYQAELRRFFLAKLPYDWIDDVSQETWIAFFNYVRGKEVKKGVSNLLWTIAKNKRADAVRERETEKDIENDIPSMEDIGTAEEELEDEAEEYREKIRLATQLCFTSPIKSNCQRVILALRGLYGYRSKVVSRLLDKEVSTVNTHFGRAIKRIIKYYSSEDYYLMVANQELGGATYDDAARNPTIVIDRFANPINPQIILEEPGRILTPEDIQKTYIASLLMPWDLKQGQLDESRHLYLAVTDRTQWTSLLEIIQRLSQDQTYASHLTIETLEKHMAEEVLFRLDIDGDNIIPSYQCGMALFPELLANDDKESLKSTFPLVHVSVHSPRLIVPMYAFFDRKWLFDSAQADIFLSGSEEEKQNVGIEWATFMSTYIDRLGIKVDPQSIIEGAERERWEERERSLRGIKECDRPRIEKSRHKPVFISPSYQSKEEKTPLFFDDFSNPASGWEVRNRFHSEIPWVGYENDEYHIVAEAGKIQLGRGPYIEGEYVVQVDARMISEGVRGAYGLLFACRGGIEIQPYWWKGIWVFPTQGCFMFTGEKYASSGLSTVDTLLRHAIEPFLIDTMMESRFIRREKGAVNRMKIKVQNDGLSLYVNDHLLETIRLNPGSWYAQSSQLEGNLALGIWNLDQSGMLHVHFDDFIVDRPGAS